MELGEEEHGGRGNDERVGYENSIMPPSSTIAESSPTPNSSDDLRLRRTLRIPFRNVQHHPEHDITGCPRQDGTEPAQVAWKSAHIPPV